MGCCSSRCNDDGCPEFTKNNQDHIKEVLAKKEDLVNQIKGLYDKGWRFHHVDNDGKTYVTMFVEANLENVLESDQLTISELALSQNNNAKHIFSNAKIVEKISAKYFESYGFEFKDQSIINEFNEAEAKISDEKDKNVFKRLRAIFNIPHKVAVEPNKDHNNEVHHDDKQNEVHNPDTNAQVHS